MATSGPISHLSRPITYLFMALQDTVCAAAFFGRESLFQALARFQRQVKLLPLSSYLAKVIEARFQKAKIWDGDAVRCEHWFDSQMGEWLSCTGLSPGAQTTQTLDVAAAVGRAGVRSTASVFGCAANS